MGVLVILNGVQDDSNIAITRSHLRVILSVDQQQQIPGPGYKPSLQNMKISTNTPSIINNLIGQKV